MRIPSSVLVGFAISLTSVVLNTIVLSSIDTRLKAADSEYVALVEALNKQVDQLNEAEVKFDLYRIMHYMALSSPAAKTQEAKEDAKAILQGFLTKFYAAANDISSVELTRVAVDEAGDIIPKMEKMLALMRALQQSPDQSAHARLALEIEKLGKEESPPKSVLAQKLREVKKYSEMESAAANKMELMSMLIPVMKSFREQIVESIKQKEIRMHELERKRSSLARKSTYATYAAISLQVFGLMFILAKNVIKDK